MTMRSLMTCGQSFAGTRTRNRAASWAALILGAVVAVAVAAPAFGLIEQNARPSIDFANAEKLASSTTSTGATAALWEVPTTDGGRCVLLKVSSGILPPTPALAGRGGGICQLGGGKWQDVPIAPTLNWLPTHNGFQVIVAGTVEPSAKIDRMELRSGAETMPLGFERDAFVGELAPVSSAGTLADSGPQILAGYDSAGRKVATLDLRQQLYP